MTRHLSPRTALLLVFAASSLSACTAILGGFDFEGPATGGSSSTSGGAGGSTTSSMGGAGGTTTSSVGGAGGTTTSSTGTGGATGGAGGTGGAPTCAQGETQPCYTGPAGTEGKGICKAGVAACLPDGTGFGTCAGEVKPGVEDCYTKGDEDCNDHACSDAVWNTVFTDTNGEIVTGLAVDSQGALYVAGTFNYILTVGGSTITALGGGAYNDYYLVKFDGVTGAVQWLKRFGDAVDNGVYIRVAVDGADNVLIAGELRGSADFGGGLLTSAGNSDIFVAKLDAAGTHQWSKTFGSATYQRASHMAADASGNVLLAGEFLGSFTFGGSTGQLTNPSSNTHTFYAAIDGTGTAKWSKRLDDPAGYSAGQFTTAGIVANPAEPGHCFVAGTFSQGVNLGGSTFGSVGGADIYLAELDAGGGHVWSQPFGSTAADNVFTLASSPTGDVAIFGRHGGTINFGTGNITQAAGTHYAAKLNGLGVPLWARAFGGAGSMSAGSLAFGSQGDLFLAGAPTGNVDFGAGPLLSGGGRDAALVKLAAGNGGVLWNKLFGNAQEQWADLVAVAPASGHVVIAGGVVGTINFGIDTLNGSGNAFLATFQP